MTIYNFKKSVQILKDQRAQILQSRVQKAYMALVQDDYLDVKNFTASVSFPVVNNKLKDVHNKIVIKSIRDKFSEELVKDLKVDYDGRNIVVECTFTDDVYERLRVKKWKRRLISVVIG